MNQEKIMKAKMITAIVICIAALAGLFVFIGLYMDKSEEVRKTYIAKYMENLSAASEEIDTYLENGKDYNALFAYDKNGIAYDHEKFQSVDCAHCHE